MGKIANIFSIKIYRFKILFLTLRLKKNKHCLLRLKLIFSSLGTF